jgi:rhamnosyltransferase
LVAPAFGSVGQNTPKPTGEGKMKVSVIVPTRNGGRYLERLFKSLGEQTVKPVQMLVVDSSSDDDTNYICKAFGADFIQIDAETFDHGGTRNLAASRAIGDIFVFMTQDTLFENNECLKNLISPLKNPIIAASYGRQIHDEDTNHVEAFAKSFNYPSVKMIKGIDDLPKLGVKTFFFSNACSAIKKRAYEEIGGFPERTIMNEDMFLAAKLLQRGYKIAYQSDAVVYHSHHYSLATQFKRYFDIGVFFNRNRWIKEIAKSEREGVRYLKEEIRFLSANGQKNLIPYALADTTVRFLGYRMGLLEENLPFSLKKKVSLNKNFWKHTSSLKYHHD